MLERKYNEQYGCFPDYHFAKLINDGYKTEEASRIIQDNIDSIWQEINLCRKSMPIGFRPLNDTDELPF